MGDRGVRRNDDAGASDMRPPADVDICVIARKVIGEAADGFEQIGPNQHRHVGHRKGVAGRIVLLLVQFTWFRDRGSESKTVDRPADLDQGLGRLGIDNLRAHDAGVFTKCLFDKGLCGPRMQHHIVVAKQVERRPLDHVFGSICGGPEPNVLVEASHKRPRKHCSHGFGGIQLRVVVDDQHAEIGIVLRCQRFQCLCKPRSRIVDDDDGNDWRYAHAGGGACIRFVGDQR